VIGILWLADLFAIAGLDVGVRVGDAAILRRIIPGPKKLGTSQIIGAVLAVAVELVEPTVHTTILAGSTPACRAG